MGFYSMPRYFEHMPQVGKPMKKANPENEAQLKAIEAEIHELIKAAQSAGRSDESLNESGQLTALQRVENWLNRALSDRSTPCTIPKATRTVPSALSRAWAALTASGLLSLLLTTRSLPVPGYRARPNACSVLLTRQRPCASLLSMS